MKIISTACEGRLNVELYSDDGYYIMTFTPSEDGYHIPDELLEQLNTESKERLSNIIIKQDDDEDDIEIDDQIAVNLNRRAMGNINTPKANYVENNDPQSRAKLSKPPPKPSMFLGKPQEEKYSDYRRVKTPPSIVKGILSELSGFINLLDKREEEERKRIQYEIERADKLRNERRNT